MHPAIRSSDGIGAAWKNSTIELRSRSDRAAIEHGAFEAESTPRLPEMFFVKIYSEIDAQSMHDQATIVVDRGRSRRETWPRNAEIVAEIEAHSRLIPKLQRRPKETLPRPLQTASTTALIALKIGPNSLFKSMYFPLLFFNF